MIVTPKWGFLYVDLQGLMPQMLPVIIIWVAQDIYHPVSNTINLLKYHLYAVIHST